MSMQLRTWIGIVGACVMLAGCLQGLVAPDEVARESGVQWGVGLGFALVVVAVVTGSPPSGADPISDRSRADRENKRSGGFRFADPVSPPPAARTVLPVVSPTTARALSVEDTPSAESEAAEGALEAPGFLSATWGPAI